MTAGTIKSRVAMLHAKGMTNKLICEATGFTLLQVTNAVNHSGLRANKSGPTIDSRVMPLHALGLTNKEIMEETGLSCKQVYYCFHRNGVISNRAQTATAENHRRLTSGIRVGRYFDGTSEDTREKLEAYAAKYKLTLWEAVDGLLG